ncbi:MAG TPA: hypothetical protein VF859_02900, partial [Burkholderiales bacterium]
VIVLEQSPGIGAGRLNAMTVCDNPESSRNAPSTLVEMRTVTLLEKVHKSLGFDVRRVPTEFASGPDLGIPSIPYGPMSSGKQAFVGA